ncbi:hypothetical protein ACFX1R_015191 [Malus domestica]
MITIYDSHKRPPFLFKIGTDDGNNPNLALVWQPSVPGASFGPTVRWSKFTIHPIVNTNPSGSGQPLGFRAQLVTNGEHKLSKKSSRKEYVNQVVVSFDMIFLASCLNNF